VAPLISVAGYVVAEPFLAAMLARVKSTLSAFHQKNPLVSGLAKEELRSREAVPAALFDAILGRDKGIAADGDLVRLATHRVSLKQDESDASAKIEELFRAAGLTVPALSEVLAKSGVDSTRGRNLLQILLKSGRLLRVGADLVYHAEAIAELRAVLAPRKGQRFSVGDFKDWTGISRKYAIPLLEFLDVQRVTRRDGDSRIVL